MIKLTEEELTKIKEIQLLGLSDTMKREELRKLGLVPIFNETTFATEWERI